MNIENKMLNLSILTDREKQPYQIRCVDCGKFISRKQIENKEARFHFIPDNEFGPEESYWEHIKC